MTKFIGWLVIIILIAGGLYLALGSRGASPQTGTATTTSGGIVPGVSNSTYTNKRLSFSIQYPANATSSAVDFSGYLPLTQTPVASFVLPSDMYVGTNLAEAGVYIGATTTPEVMTACENPTQNAGETFTGTTTISGQNFASFTSTDAGAGNFYESKTYRTYQNGSCFEIVELLHSGNIGNYTPGTVREFDKAKFQNILDSIVYTYFPIPTGI